MENRWKINGEHVSPRSKFRDSSIDLSLGTSWFQSAKFRDIPINFTNAKLANGELSLGGKLRADRDPTGSLTVKLNSFGINRNFRDLSILLTPRDPVSGFDGIGECD